MSNTILKWLTAVAILLFIVSILIFWFGGSSFSESRVAFAIDAPTQASVGDQVTYKVTYQNTTKTDLTNVSLNFTYPSDAVILNNGQVVPNSSNSQTITINSIKAGASGEQDFQAFLVGDRGDIETAKATLTFNAGSLTSNFSKDATLSTTITDLPVSLTLDAPPSAVPGGAVEYILDYRNTSSDDISDLKLTFTYPDGFTVTQSSPKASTSPNVWSVGTLAQGGSGRITIDGTLTGNQGDSKGVMVTLQRGINGTYIDYEKASATTVISSPLLSVALAANGSADYVSYPGDTLTYTVNYKNTSTYTLTGLTLTVLLEGDMLDTTQLDTQGGFYDSSQHTITWNSTAVPAFATLSPNQSGTITFRVKLKSTLPGTSSNNVFVHTNAQLETDNVPSGVNGNTVTAQDDLITKITTQPNFTQTVYAHDAAFGGTGPLPPKAGQQTTYMIHWDISNPGNALTNAKVTATLPQGVAWKNIFSVGVGQPQPTYNASTSQLTWSVGTIPSGVGINGTPALELVFQIGLTPSTTNVGSPATILKSPALSGSDAFTSQAIVVNGADLTTNDPTDAPNQGQVTN